MHSKPTNGVNTDYQARVGTALDALDRRLKGNLLDNGAFQVWQRGAGGFASAGAVVWTADRWGHARTGFVAGATATRATGSQAQYCARVQRDAANASTATVILGQTLESVNSLPYRSKPIALRFRARAGANYSSAASALGCIVRTGTGTDESLWTGFTGSADAISTTVILTTSWQTFEAPTSSLTATLGASINQIGVIFQFTPVGVAGAADYFEIEEIQLVFGDVNGEFPYKSFGEELRECQRFYCKSFPYATAPAQNAGTTGSVSCVQAGGAAAAQFALAAQFPVRMRATPTVTGYNPGAANAQVRNLSAGTDWSATAIVNVADTKFDVTATSAGGSAAGHAVGIQYQATADI